MSITWLSNALLTFTVVYLLVRLVGKRAIGQMSAFDLAVIMVSGSFFAHALEGKLSWPQALVTGTTFYAIYYGFTLLLLNNKFRKWVNDKPTVLISNNRIRETGLREVRMSVSELLGELRLKGFKSISDVEFAIMEEEGKVSVIPKAAKEPVLAEDLHLNKPTPTLAVPVVVAGELIEDNLHVLHRDQKWLSEQIAKQGLTPDDIPNLSLVQVETNGDVTIDIDEPAMKGKWRDEYQSGQYASRLQAETAIMPPYNGYPGVADVTQQALEQKEHGNSNEMTSPLPMQQLQQTLSQLQEQQAAQQQMLQDILRAVQTASAK